MMISLNRRLLSALFLLLNTGALDAKGVLVYRPSSFLVKTEDVLRYCRALQRELDRLGTETILWEEKESAIAAAGLDVMNPCADAECATFIGYRMNFDRVIVGEINRTAGAYSLQFEVFDARQGVSLSNIKLRREGEFQNFVASTVPEVARVLCAPSREVGPGFYRSRSRRKVIRAVTAGCVLVAATAAFNLIQNGKTGEEPLEGPDETDRPVVLEW